MIRTKPVPVFALAAFAFVVLLVACGDDDAGDPTATPAGSPGGQPTSVDRAPREFEGACDLIIVTDLDVLLGSPAAEVEIDDEGSSCTWSGPDATLTVVIEERENAQTAAAEVAATGGDRERLRIGDVVGYLIDGEVITSRGPFFVTFSLEPPDDDALVGIASRATARLPTPAPEPD